MKRGELQVGGQYAIADGRTRCVILSLEMGWQNSNWGMYGLETNTVTRFPYSYGADARRFPVAVEVVEKASSEINPSTGEPWTPEELYYTPGDLNHYLRAGKPLTADVVVGTRWHPYAARTVDIKAPWQAVLDDRAGELAAKAAEYPLRLQRDREREAAQERQRIENEKLNHEHRIREAQATEFYEQRLRPRLVELGVDHDTPYGTGAGHVRITHEELGRLLDLLDPNLTRDT